MLVFGFDTETTGLDVEKDHITQVGGVVWDTSPNALKRAKYKVDLTLKGDHLPEQLDPKVTEVTGLVRKDLDDWGFNPVFVLEAVAVAMERCDAIVAHNGNAFDKPMWENNCKRHGVTFPEKLWIDTSCDIEFPAGITTRRLTHLAAEHGFVNPFPHDAISDVLTMLKIAQLYDWQRTLEYAKAPTLIIKAETTFAQKELAKKQNFRWDGDKKMWSKSIKQFQLEEARKAALEAGFKITVLKGA
jgi:DNA polymerase-3 subunit epsilon